MVNGVKIKTFLGCPLNSHLKLLLSKSIEWKNAKIVGQATSNLHKLQEITYQGQQYIGLFLPNEESELSDVKKLHDETLEELRTFIPDLDQKSVHFLLFPQIFVE